MLKNFKIIEINEEQYNRIKHIPKTNESKISEPCKSAKENLSLPVRIFQDQLQFK